jgi:prepilin-type N-terminal cleavage/methylation domain-containing protein/prepilin-type processing-associated H-X9-DG protein
LSKPRKDPSATAQGGRRAFTLIELLVVVAIIALLISILLPSLSSAREHARAVVCGQHMRQFGNGLQIYFGDNKDYIPGVNTSGVAIRAKMISMGGNPSVLYQSKMPVQSFDWMTPILAPGMEMPALRSERFRFLMERYRCPSQMYTSITYYGSSGPDKSEFQAQGAIPGVSYLMPGAFQYFGQRSVGKVVGFDEKVATLPILAKVSPAEWEVLVQDFSGRLNQIGPAARKIFAADGTRFVDESTQVDHATSPFPDWFGSYTSPGGWWSGCQAYGVRGGSKNWAGMAVGRGSVSNGLNLPVTYRHGGQRGIASGDAHDNKGTINALFFDGHVDRLADQRSRELQFWYPKGGVVQSANEGMTGEPVGSVVP